MIVIRAVSPTNNQNHLNEVKSFNKLILAVNYSSFPLLFVFKQYSYRYYLLNKSHRFHCNSTVKSLFLALFSFNVFSFHCLPFFIHNSITTITFMFIVFVVKFFLFVFFFLALLHRYHETRRNYRTTL